MCGNTTFDFCSLPEDEVLGDFQEVAMEYDPNYCQWCKDAEVHADPGRWRIKAEENVRHFWKSLACDF